MHKTALVLEAGGMRNAFLSGVFLHLQELGLDVRSRVDAVYACSSAAATAAFLLSGQIDLTRRIWLRLAGSEAFGFANVYRFGRPGNIDFVIDEICESLDIAEVAAASAKLMVNVVRAQDGRCVYLDARDNLKNVLKATSALPYLCRATEVAGLGRCLDGGIADPFPLLRALADGADRVIVVSNRPKGFQVPKHEHMLPSYLLRSWRSVYRTYRAMPRLYEQTRQVMEDAQSKPWCYVIQPKRHLPLHRFSRDENQVAAAIACGIDVGQAHVKSLSRFLER